tara:strand:+ start:389 stop:640 length:252 start_codon:yes stop_codon:yes gene_type:complete
MKVNGLIKSPKWKEFFKHDSKNINCVHCKYQKAEDSIPKKDFTIKIRKNITKSKPDGDIVDLVIKELKIVRGSDEDIIGFVNV